MLDYSRIKEAFAEHQDQDFYSQLLGEYDQMIDWESRLQRETPFFQKILKDYQVDSLLDMGCGTGRHCFHFVNLGVAAVVGADASEKIIELARKRTLAIGCDVQFVQATFTNLTDCIRGSFSLITCLGNSISHLLTYDDLELTFKNFRSLLSDKGHLLIHCLNWERRLTLQERFFPPKGHHTPEGEKLFFRFFDFHEELVTMNLNIFFRKESSLEGKWSNRHSSTTLRPWRQEIIRMALDDAGLKPEREYGGMDFSPFHPINSHDYIVIAGKA